MGSKNDHVFSTVRVGAYQIHHIEGKEWCFLVLLMYPVVGAYRIRPSDATDGGEYMSCVRPLGGDVGEGVCNTPLPVRPQKLNPYVFSITLTDEKNEPRGCRGSKNGVVRITAPKCGFKKRSH